jgi:hypothetical protein
MRDRLQADGYTPHHDKVDAEMIANRLWFRCVCRGRMTYIGLRRPGSCPLQPLRPLLRVLSSGRTPANACRMTTRKEFHP